MYLKEEVHIQNENFQILYSPLRHPRCSCLSFFSCKEVKVFEENTPEFFSIIDIVTGTSGLKV